MRYQIRQNGFGLALIEGESSMDALLKFVAEQGGDLSEVEKTSDKTVVWEGQTFYTEPPD